MDVSALTSRYGTIPVELQKEVDAVWGHLQEQANQVVAVKFTSNFGVDKTNSLIYSTPVHKGLIVEVKPKYVVSEKDSWIHPNLNQCRALYKEGKVMEGHEYPAAESLDKTNCSAGVYSVQTYNEIGDLKKVNHTIVDIHLKDRAVELRRSWNGKTIDTAYSTAMRDETLEHANSVAQEIFQAGDRMRADFTNILYRGRGSFFFYNNSYKESGLVLISPLSGYTVVNKTNHAADYLDTELIKVNTLDRKLQQSFYTKASWNEGQLVNTYVMSKSYSNVGAEYRMSRASFSTTPDHQFMTPAELLELTPHVKHVPEHVVAGLEEHMKEDKIQIPLTAEVLDKLIGLRDQVKIFNEEFYSNKKLVLPRDVVNLII